MAKHEAPPLNRREFISRLATGYAAMSFTPTVLSWIFQQTAAAQAATMADGTLAGSLIPFMVFDLAGGAGMPGNFLVGNQGGPEDLLTKGYGSLGWNPKETDALEKRFGLPMSKKYSQMLLGLTQTASTGALNNLRFSSICHFAIDDSPQNMLSSVALVNKAGLYGTAVKEPLGQTSSPSGGNSRAAFQASAMSAVPVSSLQTILDSAGFIGRLQSLDPKLLKKMSMFAQKLNAEQLKKFSQMSDVQQLGAVHGGFFAKTATDSGVSSLDPRANTNSQGVYGINANTALTDRNAILAGISLGAISGATGPGVITIGGCDYHTGSQQAGDAKDLEVGREIGRSVELAFRLKKPLFFQVLTDGGVSATPGTRNWSGESGVRGMTVMGMYDPNQPAKQRRLQLGHYTNGEVAEQGTLLGRDATKIAAAVAVNYLNVCGKLSEVSSVIPSGTFSSAELDSVICFDRG